MFQIDVAGFTIWGERPRRIPAPVFLERGGFTGWDDTPDLRRESNDRVNAHGVFDAAGYYTARTASFSGQVVTDSARETAAIGRRMRGLLADGGSGRVTVQRDDITEWAIGRLASSTKFTIDGADPTVAAWQMQFWFPDPRKYGSIQSFGPGTSVTAQHYGNTFAFPRLTVSGSDPAGYTVTGTNGRTWRVTLPLVTQFPHTIDMATGLLTANGSIRTGVTPRADIWRAAPGRPVTQSVVGASGGSVSLQVAVTDTYV